MKIVIVYDSFFGNTEKVARAICEAVEQQGDVQMLRATEVKLEHVRGADKLIIGSPTRKFRPSDSTTSFLKSLSAEDLKGVKAAAFDTRISLSDIHSAIGRFFVKNFGYAAPFITKELKKKGAEIAAPPAGFDVIDSEGPLKEGELDRARQWANSFV
jgi:flavodoxin I